MRAGVWGGRVLPGENIIGSFLLVLGFIGFVEVLYPRHRFSLEPSSSGGRFI